jgi:hypothetical protein
MVKNIRRTGESASEKLSIPDGENIQPILYKQNLNRKEWTYNCTNESIVHIN